MYSCILPADIFGHLLTLSNYYLPLGSFLALRAVCRQMKTLYTKQKYIDKYKVCTKKYKIYEQQNFMRVKIKNILPNGLYHGYKENHHFNKIEPITIGMLGNGVLKKGMEKIAITLDLPELYDILNNYRYLSSYSEFYYLGKSIGPKTISRKLIDENLIFQIQWIDCNIMYIWDCYDWQSGIELHDYKYTSAIKHFIYFQTINIETRCTIYEEIYYDQRFYTDDNRNLHILRESCMMEDHFQAINYDETGNFTHIDAWEPMIGHLDRFRKMRLEKK